MKYRDENGKIKERKELLKVSKLGPAAFTQCAGFLRIIDGKNPLDNTSVHPESYDTAEKILASIGFSSKDLYVSCKAIYNIDYSFFFTKFVNVSNLLKSMRNFSIICLDR